jgi:O-antigen/teichoic acid export membrane protein
MVYLVSGGFWLFTVQIITIIFSFALALAFANLLPKEIYGTYKYIMSLVGIFSIFTLTGIRTNITRSVSQGYDGVFVYGLKKSLLWNSFPILMATIASLYYYIKEDVYISTGILLAGILSPILTTTKLWTSFVFGKQNFKLNLKYNSILTILSTTVTILILFYTNSYIAIIATTLLSQILINAYIIKKILKLFKPSKKINTDFIKYSKQLSITNALMSFANRIEQILVWHFLGAAPLAIYSMATTIPNQFQRLSGTIRTLALPKISSSTFENVRVGLMSKTIKISVVYFFIITLYTIFAPTIFKLFFPQYIDSVTYSQLFSISLLLKGASFLYMETLIAHKRIRAIYLVNIITPTIRILLYLVLLPIYGLWGIITATILALSLRIILLITFVHFDSFIIYTSSD